MINDAPDPYGTEWSTQEVELAVADYFEMFRLERQGQKYNKAEHNRQLQESTRRTRTSIERKHQNISAVLGQLGLPSISGYKPLGNFQQSLLDAIESYLSIHGVPHIDLPHVLSAQESPLLFGTQAERTWHTKLYTFHKNMEMVLVTIFIPSTQMV
jgi:hypothetical protein